MADAPVVECKPCPKNQQDASKWVQTSVQYSQEEGAIAVNEMQSFGISRLAMQCTVLYLAAAPAVTCC